MSKKPYEELPVAHLSDEQLTDMLRYSEPFTEDDLTAIQGRFHEKISDEKRLQVKPNKKYKHLLLLAASLLLFAVGFTQLDAVTAFYYQFFGDAEGSLVEQAEPLTSVVEDQGIELRALSTFQDGETTYFLMQLTDLTENRLDETVRELEWGGLGFSPSRFIAFDERTNTATFLTSVDAKDVDITQPQLTLLSFKSQLQHLDEKSDIQLVDYLQQEPTWIEFSEQIPFQTRELLDPAISQALEQRITGTLLPAEREVPLMESGELLLSNIGYKEGLLHIQIKVPNDPQHRFTELDLQNPITGETRQPLASFLVDRKTLNIETGRTDYLEFVFEVPLEKLNQYEIHVSGESYGIYQKGEWALDVTRVEPIKAKQYQDISLTMEDQSFNLKNIQLSPVNLSFSISGLSSTTRPLSDTLYENLSVKVLLEDGTTQLFNQAFKFESETSESSRVQVEGTYVDLDKVVEISINGQTLKEQ